MPLINVRPKSLHRHPCNISLFLLYPAFPLLRPAPAVVHGLFFILRPHGLAAQQVKPGCRPGQGKGKLEIRCSLDTKHLP